MSASAVLACMAAVVFALDASGSINADEWRQQTEGTAAALVSEEMKRALRNGGPVAVAVVAFADGAAEMIRWQVIEHEGDARVVAEALAPMPRPAFGIGATLVAEGLARALDLFDAAPCETEQRIVDVSTDGEPSDARRATMERDRAYAAGVRVNGLLVGDRRGAREWMLTGLITAQAGGFLIVADDWERYAEAIRRKLILEITAAPGGGSGEG